jgi:urea transport system substrate-binding protein
VSSESFLPGRGSRDPRGGDPVNLDATVAIDSASSTEIERGLNPLLFLGPPADAGELDRLGHYRIRKMLGQGGMGMVFEAEDTHLQRTVALKVILPEYAAHPASRERFLREARAGAALKSDHVVTIYQVGEEQGVPFLAMEMLHGRTLDDRLNEGTALPIPEVLRIGREIADGLAAAHASGMIHRDVKPANVWLEEPLGRVKLLDFGLARAVGSRSDLTQVGRVIGTPSFMSPEQARGDEVDARGDLFSLGAVLYALCTGRRPFEGTSIMAVLTALAVTTPRPSSTLNPEVPPALSELVGRLLQKNAKDRPESALEVREALISIEAALTGPTIRRSGSTTPSPKDLGNRAAGSPLAQARRGRRTMLLGLVATIVGLGSIGGLAVWLKSQSGGREPAKETRGSNLIAAPTFSGSPIRVGILHSRTGTMAISERPVIDAVLLAVEELNSRGGVLGRRVESVLADGQSDEEVFALEAEKLITKEKVAAIFGCWTSASRKAVVPVVERHDHLLYYSVQYEGLEQSPNVVCLGPVPNQQITPALRWLVGFEAKRHWFLVGSDYVFPAVANAVIRDEAKAAGCEIVGEEYQVLGSTEVDGMVRKIIEAKPDLIVNTINGDTNVAFFRALRRAGVKSKDVPVLSFSISEEELSNLGARLAEGDYVAANYFQSLDSARNREFKARFGKRYGPERVISSAMESAYASVFLWAAAVKSAGRIDPRLVSDATRGQSFDAPQGMIHVDRSTRHAIQIARVGRVNEEGRLVEVYLSPRPIDPEPFPRSRTRDEWNSLLQSLRERWGGRWSNPGP